MQFVGIDVRRGYYDVLHCYLYKLKGIFELLEVSHAADICLFGLVNVDFIF